MTDPSFLAQMAWKSALISAAALALSAALRARPAADRAAVLRVGMLLLLLLPVIALSLPALRVEAWAAAQSPSLPYFGGTDIGSTAPALGGLPATEPVRVDPVLSPPPEPAGTNAGLPAPLVVGLQAVEAALRNGPAPLVALIYIAGLLTVAARLLAGLWTLRSWTASARPVACPEWLAAFERARPNSPIGERLRLLVCASVSSPLSWGWPRPVILIDRDTLDRPDGAEAILAHEVAHVVHRDWPVLILSRLVTALFWFNPLVWLLEREVVQQAEQAADRKATELVEPARYAQTLLNWAQDHGAAVPALGIAPAGPALARRIRAILDEGLRERPANSAWTALSISICIGVAAPVAALELVSKGGLVVEEKATPIAPSHRSDPAEISLTAPALDRTVATTGPQPAHSLASATVTVARDRPLPDRAGALGPMQIDAPVTAREYQAYLATLQARHAETVAAARREWQANATALQVRHAETTAAARKEWQANASALRARHSAATAVRNDGSRPNDGSARIAGAEAQGAFQQGRREIDEAFRITQAEADEAFQTGWRENDEAFQTRHSQATEAFEIGRAEAAGAFRARHLS